MPKDTATAQRYSLRHPDNNNLSLYYDETYDGLPVMIEKGPFIREYLSDLKHTIDLALAEYPRVFAFRVDLRLPRGIELPDYAYTNQVISEFFESFTKKIRYDQERVRQRDGYARGCKVRYAWSREVPRGGRPHYHVLILLNRDAYYTIGRLRSARTNMISRMGESWAGALGISVDQAGGLVNIPKNAEYRVDRYVRRGEEDELPVLFYRASYLCKVATKSYGNRQRGFDTSRG
ncbi:TPA: inovirus Gp2 family protein [Pseudomonas aeruginosa]|uniref:inovirus Gp2 family protein n=3 Tax=Pseudomonas aeruginosa TaxID=287 RepID=UPI0010691127|nr:inovirus Gp2 family protein [Pseudomonas aeruginosa]MBV5609621.1 inovirus Gp2 family protein [Pseudomonas aeruginosa]MBV5906691.1 inovirus Gp2 family protein [Pseudomonas aeruginosa]MDH0065380.1 inovirus Gp2 family protein [Pseudomonas aeruginosa]HBN9701674.1 inovirus Gp2 family protein [Pseudomonas aeruginosa]HBN9720618.1 inovirus Gp2 family protein [Pseudomonas aeruginosa]